MVTSKANQLCLFDVYRQDPPRQGKKKSNGDGSFSIEHEANLTFIGEVQVSDIRFAMDEAKRKFKILHPVIDVTENIPSYANQPL